MNEAGPGSPDNGEGPRRRRRRGGRGGERAERAPRENFAAEGASPADAIESRAAELERAREPEARDDSDPPPPREPQLRIEHESRQYDPRLDDVEPEGRVEAAPRTESPPVRETKLAYSSAPPPRTFQVVSEHDTAQEESHKPQRKRRHGASAEAQPQELQLVETQVEAAPLPVEDELPRRTKPRRRRSEGPAAAEPLMLVETQPGEAQRSDGAPAP